MSESCRENLPLLSDEYSDEDFLIRKSKAQRLFRYSTSSGRARSQALGAASIISRWPEHVSSFLTYWWIGLGMLAFIIFFIYNSIVAMSMLSPTYLKPVKLYNTESRLEYKSNKILETNTYMHIFVNNYEELNINDYLPYIDTFSKKYSFLKHNLIVVLKEITNDDLNNLSDELNNEIALNSLWTKKEFGNKIKLGQNTHIQIISLTKYMDDSPLKKYWRRLPQPFLTFLTRCIAIWEKGGVAFDPLILIPNSPTQAYRESLERILNNLTPKSPKKSMKDIIFKTPQKKINNIQDIINDIEHNDEIISQETLLEAESKKKIFKLDKLNMNKVKRHTKELPLQNIKDKFLNSNQSSTTRYFEQILYKNKTDKNLTFNEDSHSHLSTSRETNNGNRSNDMVTTKPNVFPKFLEYLFHQPPNFIKHVNEPNTVIRNVTINYEVSTVENKSVKKRHNNLTTKTLTDKEMKDINVIKSNINSIENEKNISLSIDLKGNLIATETPCHAFIGTIFSNALHHCDGESLTDFIIAELSIFCKGVLSTCKGIDIILL